MHLLGLAGLADVEGFLAQHFPDQMAATSRIVQGMDAAAVLVRDGKVIAGASQERFDRKKKSGDFPFQAIDYCLRAGDIAIDRIDQVCGNFDFGRYGSLFALDPTARLYWQQCLAPAAIQAKLEQHYGRSIPFQAIDHHEAHLHSALVSAPFDRSLVIVMDAAGEIGATSVYRVERNIVERLRRYQINASLGLLYSLVTQFLGFAFNEDEYKVMGLAALGNPARYAKFFETAIVLGDDGDVRVPPLTLNKGFAENLFFTATSSAICDGLGFDGLNTSLSQKADVSAALQQRFTEALFHIAEYFRKQTGLTNLIMSGGCAENCAAIGELRKSGMFDRIHVSYASGDEGTALGAASAFSHVQGTPVHLPRQMPFFGPEPQIRTVRSLVREHCLAMDEYTSEAAMLAAAADDIAADRIIALCHGRMEFGARALGNRSLLALPSKMENKERINLAIKKRQNYRPFAPAVTIEDAHRYFDLRPGEDYPYMTMLTRVRDEYQDLLPAITHFDGTARVQTVDRTHNPAFYQFLSFLRERTGMPVVLNTSYNVNHQPIVCTEQEAIETFLEMDVDALYIAQARISKTP